MDITLEEHIRVLNAYQELQNKNKELIQKIKINEKSRRKMQQSLMKKIKKQKEVIDKVIELLKSQEQDMMGNYFFDDNIAEQLLDILKEASE